MGKRTLIAYASRFGSTKETAEAIGQVLNESGLETEIKPMQEATDLSSYDAVVAGSAIQGQKWLPEAIEFVQTHKRELSSKPFAAFMVCITLGMKNAESYRQGVTQWMAPVRQLARPVSEGYFAGRLDTHKLPFSPNGLALRAMVVTGVFPKGDKRDWQAIRNWAKELAGKL